MKVTVLGNIASDIQIATVGNNPMAKFQIGERKSRVNGEKKTNYWNVTVFGKTVETLNKFFHKGSPICITGNADWNEYTGKDGTARKSVDIVANSVDFVPKEYAANDNAPGYTSPQYNAQPQQATPAPAPAPAPAVTPDDDLPF